MMNYQTIELERGKFVSTVWLNRPAMHNAMNDIMIAELTEVFVGFSSEKDLRLIVLRGKGKSFCAGADLNYMKNIATYGLDENRKDSIKLAQLFSAIYTCIIPSVAVVHGACFGGANGLVAACDIAVAEMNSTFAFSEVKIGIAPATIAPFVIKRIGEYGARELMVSGRRFNAEEAVKWKLVNHAWSDEDLEMELDNIKKQILSNGPNSVRATKELIRWLIHESPGMLGTQEYTSQLIAELRASQEGQEGMSSFLEKRKPDWIVD